MLDRLLDENRKDIVATWRREILDTYPDDTARFIKGEPNRIANPVGHVLTQGVEDVFDELQLQSAQNLVDDEKLITALDGLIRIRSVQDLRPAQAVGIIFLLKKVVRAKLGNEIAKSDLYQEQLLFEDRVDRMALLAFETYMRCREDLFAIKTRSLKNGPFKLHERSKKRLDAQKNEEKDHKNNGNSSE